ncbi:uncharacterized protein EI97DRAFT_248059 [Westerdykella ornata]|uniref:Autophagy-related protein 14 n=1 Tax=Westerdykella ornata TaxID=318751 RepID=A0A6A6JPL5_WESOR|nr:uncharacterized protein EI97DRAFT_248059 [Westerdykella ornata]KAF2278204.1 hypothetical protein EI97DRAFT_248059 [Westerdykella ornata]
MECDICGKTATSTTPILCITCARCAIEVPRIALASALIDRGKTGRVVQAVVEGSEDKATQYVSLADSKGGLLVDRSECTKNADIQRMRAETAEHEERIQLIGQQAEKLRENMEATRKLLEERRREIAQRKSDISSATYGIEARRANEVDKVQHSIKRLEYNLDKVHKQTMEVRRERCASLARLAGLKMGKRKMKDGTVKEVYTIGPGSRLRIYDLRDLHDASSDSLSASLGLVAQLVVRAASYLGVRLPAEITLPHTDYPLATIFRPASSYLGQKIPFPGGGQSTANSPEGSRTLDAHANLPKPRSLSIDRPLTHLSAQDTPAYLLFIEGISLLAYDVAYLCRTQGLNDEFNTWEDVSPIGRNLYRLLIDQGNGFGNILDIPRTASKNPIARNTVRFGEISHATAHSFLNSAEYVQYLAGWKLSPTKIADGLRAYLLAEQQASEWDVLSQKEWEDMEDIIAEDPVVVGMRRGELAGAGASLSGSPRERNRASLAGEAPSDSGREERKKGVSGWTKLKSRNGET